MDTLFVLVNRNENRPYHLADNRIPVFSTEEKARWFKVCAFAQDPESLEGRIMGFLGLRFWTTSASQQFTVERREIKLTRSHVLDPESPSPPTSLEGEMTSDGIYSD